MQVRVRSRVIIRVRVRLKFTVRVSSQEAPGTDPLVVQVSPHSAELRAHGSVPVQLSLWVQEPCGLWYSWASGIPLCSSLRALETPWLCSTFHAD